MAKARVIKYSSDGEKEHSSSRTSSAPEFEKIPPIVPEPPDSCDEYTAEVYIDDPSFKEPKVVDLRIVKRHTKRLIATGRLDLFVKWVKEESYFASAKNAIHRPRAYAIRQAVLNHFLILFPGYMPPPGSRSTYVPIFRELQEEGPFTPRNESWTCTRKDFYEAVRQKQPFMKSFLRGALIHPALGIFADKDTSVFKWDVTTHYTHALYNRRHFTADELKWPAFYPPLSRVRLVALNHIVDISATQGLSPCDEFGHAYLSVKDVLVSISNWIHSPICIHNWDHLSVDMKAAAVTLNASRTGRKIEVPDDEREEARQLAKAADWLPFPSFILADPIDNHPTGDEDCGGCVQCCEETGDEVMHRICDKYAKSDTSDSRLYTGMIHYDVLPIESWFKGLVNIGPYLYYLETEKLD